ncbi:MAG: UDP-glucose 4-epimerase GalE [Proteobacteria bacterium]|nr:UDP-glucose 4-epimerase GalE [Pseudomonadota bacterium]
MQILVVGGAGYIGSHMVNALRKAGSAVVVLDDLSGGHRDAVGDAELYVGSLADRALIDGLFEEHRFDAVMHFASFIEVGRSVRDPAAFYRNNLVNTLNLLDAMVARDVKRIVFSSTAAIFGEPERTPIDETHRTLPINPYGRSKWMVEQILADYEKAYGLQSVCLRYFNASGADAAAGLGERHDPETHLIPLVLQVAARRRAAVSIFGRDYGTPDGTCIRDYVHVMDLCDAHSLALERLLSGKGSGRYNLGNGLGHSVQQVIDTARAVTGRDIFVRHEARRAGDPARLVADSMLAKRELGWQPQRADLERIIADAWAWEQRHPAAKPLPVAV